VSRAADTWRSGVALLALVASVGGCGATVGQPASAPLPPGSPPVERVGRSQCPGAVEGVLTNLTGDAADAVEEVGGTYHGTPGFLAVVFDGSKAIVVVEAARLPDWLIELGPAGIAVAPSCIDPTLLAGVKAALPTLVAGDGTVSAGYNALEDSISVMGVDTDTLIDALDAQQAGMGARARAAIEAGTLRVDGAKIPSVP